MRNCMGAACSAPAEAGVVSGLAAAVRAFLVRACVFGLAVWTGFQRGAGARARKARLP